MQNYIGQQIDRYRITERLGMGGMAVVYKAYDTRLERDVALKLIRTKEIPESQHERLMKRFEREAKSQARFTHRNIVPIYDYGEVDGSPYLVMAYISGGTLKNRITGPIDWRQAVTWMIPVADALYYAHQRGVIHRDVKPSNILFDDEDQPILTDFGIAKILETNEATLTGTGLGVGTPEYMAPEQWQGQAYEATDQYALGVVLYELITGQKPYQADTPAAVAIQQATEPLKAPSRLVDGIPEVVEKVLYKVLANNQMDRYENMGAFKIALNGLQSEKDKTSWGPVIVTAAISSELLSSESGTVDALDGTAVEYSHVSDKSSDLHTRMEEKKKLIPWGIGLVISMVMIGLVIGGFELLEGNKRNNPVSIAIMNTDTPIPPTKTEVLTLTLTFTPINTRAPTEFEKETSAETKKVVHTLSLTSTVTIIPTITRTATLTYTPEPTIGIGSEMVNPIDGAAVVFVPMGEFIMGSVNGEKDESPEHRVYLDDFWINKYEVTNNQFVDFLKDRGNKAVGGTTWLDTSDFILYIEQSGDEWFTNFDAYPVQNATWYGASAYCEWAGGRLPTEAEWEKAARGSDRRLYPWGDQIPSCSLARHKNCFEVGPVSVDYFDRFPVGASPYGTMVMAGNASEWVADWYIEDYYSKSPYENPKGPVTGAEKGLRGGSWLSSEYYLRSSNRNGASRDFSSGFRCVFLP